MKKINLILRKCKTLSRQLGRTSSYSSLRSQSTREEFWAGHDIDNDDRETIFVGSSRRRYVISSKHLNHPLLNALIKKSKQNQQQQQQQQQPGVDGGGDITVVKCEVVLFDHLLWMLENADPNLSSDSLEELADLYAF